MIPKYLYDIYKKASYSYQGLKPQKPVPYFTPTKTQQEWIDWVFTGGEKLLLGARGYGKTESIILVGLFSKILANRTTTARIYTRNYEDAKDILRVLGELLKQAGCSGTFTATQIVLKENNTKEPTVSLKSILAKGHKGKHIDWVIFDDPVDLMDEFSPTLLKRVKAIYQNLSSIAKCGVITIGQYVCAGDLYTQLEKTIPTRSYWHGSVKERDKNLDELRASGKTEAFIQANYLGVLLPSTTYPFEKLRLINHKGYYDAACLDPSLKGRDYTALSLMHRTNNTIIVKVFLWKKSYIDCFEEIVDTLHKHKVKILSYEDNIIGDSAIFTFHKIKNMKVYPFRSTQNKVHKIYQLEPLIKHNAFSQIKVLFDRESDPLALEQIQNWSPITNNHDDAPDSVAMLLMQEGILG